MKQSYTPELLPRHGSQRVQIMAGTEPLNEDSSPPHRKARKSNTARDGGSVVEKKKLITESCIILLTVTHSTSLVLYTLTIQKGAKRLSFLLEFSDVNQKTFCNRS